MKWSIDEEEIVINLLKDNLKSSYSEIVKLAEELGVNRSKKSIQHKNNRYWNIERDVDNTPPYVGFGKDNPNWKGGITKHSRGYILIYCPEHPRASNRYVFEHIIVMEKKLDRYLEEGEVVHHKNGVKDDNSPDNLEVLSQREHNLKRHPYKLQRKSGLYRGRKTGHNRISLHPDVFNIISNEFYVEIDDNKIIIIYNHNI